MPRLLSSNRYGEQRGMRIRHLKVAHFRGIRELDWHLSGDFICLVGPGDSCKSTVLDAIELVLSPRWNPNLDDSDFHGAHTDQSILIEATIGALPRPLMSDAQFGLRIRGYDSSQRTIHDEPEDGDELVLTIRFECNAGLEPTWKVVTDRHPEGHVITTREREKLGVTRLGAVLDRHLSWSRGSALSRLTGDVDEHSGLLAEAAREARLRVAAEQLPQMAQAAARASEEAMKFGVRPRDGYLPRMDPSAGFESGGLTLHDGSVPLRRFGLGTRRLVTLSMQRLGVKDGGVVLIDEVEHGLEPYRLRRLLSELLSATRAGVAKDGEGGNHPATILTTHSPIALGQLRWEHVRIVRTLGGRTVILAPDETHQGTIITHAEAILSRRVVVCEGATELGLLNGLDEAWSRTAAPFAVSGVGLTDGGGAQKVAEVALNFRRLGFDTAILADSDVKLSRTTEELVARGVLPLQWCGEMATEERVFLDLPWPGVAAATREAMDTGHPVLVHLASQLKRSTHGWDDDPSQWLTAEPEPTLRSALGRAAKAGGWFKSTSKGAGLGRIIGSDFEALRGTDLGTKLDRLREWTVGD